MVLVGCGAAKADSPQPARLLYTGPMTRAGVTYAEASGLPWGILSAKYGLLEPDRVVEPYDLAVHSLTDEERRVWALRVLRQQLPAFLRRRRVNPALPLVLELHAGTVYLDPLEANLPAAWSIDYPLRGMHFPLRMRWYSQRRGR